MSQINTKCLLVGFFTTVGDTDCLSIVQNWLDQAGILYDVAPFSGRVRMLMPNSLDLAIVDASSYTHLIVICGPCWSEHYHKKRFKLERFDHCKRVGINLTMVDEIEKWNPFHLLWERDSNRCSRPDLTFLSQSKKVAVTGKCLIMKQPEYGKRQRHQFAAAMIDRAIDRCGVAAVNIDTRWCHSEITSGQKTADCIYSVMGRLDYLLTTRLHGLVFALRAGIPAIAIDPVSGGDKVTAQAKSLGWPCCKQADELTDEWLNEAMQWCLTDEAKRAVKDSVDLANQSMNGLSKAFIEGLLSDAPENEEKVVMPTPRWWQRLLAR